jgi:hypothetical protein
MHLGPEQTTAFVRQALDAGTYVVCHQTLTYGDYPDFGSAAAGASSMLTAGGHPRCGSCAPSAGWPRSSRPGRAGPRKETAGKPAPRPQASLACPGQRGGLNLRGPAVIRPHLDAHLIFNARPARIVRTAEVPADALLAGDHRGGIPLRPLLAQGQGPMRLSKAQATGACTRRCAARLAR